MSEDILTLPAPPADTRIPYGLEESQFGDLRLPSTPGPYPVVVVIHGGFWRAAYDLTHIGHLCAALTGGGAATWSVEYRRLGQPGGGWPGTFLDVALAMEYLRELAPRYNLDPARVITLGHSAGGHLALWLAGRGRIPAGDPLYTPAPLLPHAAVSLAGVADLRRGWELRLSNGVVEDFMGGAPAQLPERYATASPAELLPLGVPQLLIHGTEDRNVPYAISRDYQLAAVARGDDATLLTLPGAGHFELIDPRSREWPAIAERVGKLLATIS